MILENEMQLRKFVTEKHTGEYLDFLYGAPKCECKVPLVIYIHGAGSRGDDVELLRNNGGLINVYENCKDRAVVVASQCLLIIGSQALKFLPILLIQ